MADGKPRLGEKTVYPDHYDPGLLVSIPRSSGRKLLSIPAAMHGVDLWTGYELSWLTSRGKPRVAIGEFRVSCDTPNIVESKSFKLYLNSLNQCRFNSEEELCKLLEEDLAKGFGGPVSVHLSTLDRFGSRGITRLPGELLDELDICCESFTPDNNLLRLVSEAIVTETLCSHLLKTNCPVTGQPDWASISIHYSGEKISREGLLKYLVSFRQHKDFHENCIETIFSDILSQCRPHLLSVYARYTRRGGLDINPYRSTDEKLPEFCRLSRQ